MEHVTPLILVRARPTQPTETIPNYSTPEHGISHSSRGTGQSEDSTAEDIDILLGAVPVPLDFSLSHHHLACENEGQIEETSWWFHPIFEARAMADIRRTLRASLPSDPSQDPSPEDTDDWRAEVRPRRPGVQIWTDRLEDTFGSSSPLDRGLGLLWPKSSEAIGRCRGTSTDADRSHTQNDADTQVVIADSHRSTPPPSLELPSRNGLPSPEGVADEALHPPDAVGTVLVEAANGDSEATAPTAALTSLVKGKSTPDKAKTVRFIDAPGEVDRANERGSVARDVNTSTPTPPATNKRKRSRLDYARLLANGRESAVRDAVNSSAATPPATNKRKRSRLDYARLIANGRESAVRDAVNTSAPTPPATNKRKRSRLDYARLIAYGRESAARDAGNTSAATPPATNKRKRSRPDDAELMNKKDLSWKRCASCARQKVKCAPRVGSQPPYRCYRCEDNEQECVPNENDTRRSGEYQLHPRLRIANNATGASLRRRPRHARPSHLKDVVIPAPTPENCSLGAVRHTMKHNEPFLARLQVRKAELEANVAERNLKVALEQKRLADEQYLATLTVLEGGTRTRLEGRTRAKTLS